MQCCSIVLLAVSFGNVAGSAPPRSLINGGELVDQATVDTSFPWFVVFVRTTDCNAFCGGALVGPSTVITAAHCFFDKPDAGFNDPSVRAVVGFAGPVNTPEESDNIDGECSLPGMYKIASARKPVYYQYQVGYDVALVTLNTEIGCPNVTTVKMVGLGYNLSAWVKRHWTLLGFGATDGESGEPSPDLKKLQMPISSVGTSDEYCNMAASADKRIASLICTLELSDEEQGAAGDSGGPWTLFHTTSQARLLGAVQSSGQIDDKGGSYGFLISPAWFQDWISSTIIDTDTCLPNPVPPRASFFNGYVEHSPYQFCEFENCSACSDASVMIPRNCMGKLGPRVESCLSMKSGNVETNVDSKAGVQGPPLHVIALSQIFSTLFFVHFF